MALSNEQVRSAIRRLLLSRMRLLNTHGFYGLLLMHMPFSLDEGIETACTDGRRIVFSPTFLAELSDRELDFVMMHEILHVVLQHCLRSGDRDPEAFNIACDIVVNSIIMQSNGGNRKSITLRKYGESMHRTPNGKEGHEYTAEQVYEMLSRCKKKPGLKGKPTRGKDNATGKSPLPYPGGWDDHAHWDKDENEDEELLRDLWIKRFEDAVEAVSIRDPNNQRGTLPLFAQRMLNDLRKPQTDWRTLLSDFVQEEVVDYSFSPPDRRFGDSPFFLPDFNDTDWQLKKVLFMVDTSGSMSDDMVMQAYSEVYGALLQFDGRLEGWLGFFDAAIIKPKPFADEREFRLIKPAGGGGTDFGIIFRYVKKHMSDDPPVSIIILTDGYAPFPEEEAAGGIPVLWLLNNETVTPPWGKIARITGP